MGYFNWINDKTRSNPIIDVMVDQISHDSDMQKKYVQFDHMTVQKWRINS